MASKSVIFLTLVLVYYATARPVRKTLNFNMFVLPHDGSEKTVLTTDGVSRFGPILEYMVQRFQSLMSVRLPPEALDQNSSVDQGQKVTEELASENSQLSENIDSADTPSEVPLADAAENEVDHQEPAIPGVVVRPSQTKPGTFEVEIDVVVDEDQLKKINN